MCLHVNLTSQHTYVSVFSTTAWLLQREGGWHIYYLPTTIEGLQYWPMSRSHGGRDYSETYTHIYNEVTARGSTSTDVPSEEVMTSSPGIPLPAVLWHHQDQEVCVWSVNHVPQLSLFLQLWSHSLCLSLLIAVRTSLMLYSTSSACRTHLLVSNDKVWNWRW